MLDLKYLLNKLDNDRYINDLIIRNIHVYSLKRSIVFLKYKDYNLDNNLGYTKNVSFYNFLKLFLYD